MTRFAGQDLPHNPRIAVLANDAIGNFVVTTPLLQMLRHRYADAEIIYFGGTRTAELENASRIANVYVQLLGSPDPLAVLTRWKGYVDLSINVEQTAITKVANAILPKQSGFICGPSMGPGGRGDLPFSDDNRGDLWRDKNWIAADVMNRYSFLRSPFIGEIFCRLAFLDGPIPPYRLPLAEPAISVPDVIVSASASLPDKLWPFDKWTTVLSELASRGLSVGLVGAKPAEGAKHWLGGEAEHRMVKEGLVQDLRGTMSLPQVVGALAKAKLVLTLDNGILHLASGTPTPTVGLYRYGIHRLWAPPKANLQVVHTQEGETVAEISEQAVIEAISRAV